MEKDKTVLRNDASEANPEKYRYKFEEIRNNRMDFSLVCKWGFRNGFKE